MAIVGVQERDLLGRGNLDGGVGGRGACFALARLWF
jgi:hypothetical protein